MTTSVKAISIAIIGGGFSGTMVAVHLLQSAVSYPVHIHLIEKTAHLGKGTAYSTISPLHLLNVPAKDMSAFADYPGHFLDWAKERDPAIKADSFVERRIYGQYLSSILSQAETEKLTNITFQKICKEAQAISIVDSQDKARITMEDGLEVEADYVVLALGNFKPANPPIANASFFASDRYLKDPWSGQLASQSLKSERILLIGTGLTMIDTAMELSRVSQVKTMLAVSRHGLIPQVHQLDVESLQDFSASSDEPLKVRKLFNLIRKKIAHVESHPGGNWRSVINSLRSSTSTYWRLMPYAERARFLRHLRHYFDICRHRLPAAVADGIAKLVESGKLEIWAGRIVNLQELSGKVACEIVRHGMDKSQMVVVDRVINCTGPNGNYASIEEPLIESLKVQGLLRNSPLNLGLDTDTRGALLNFQGIPSRVLFTLGPPLKGLLLETVAVPEIRVQAKDLVGFILEDVAKGRILA